MITKELLTSNLFTIFISDTVTRNINFTINMKNKAYDSTAVLGLSLLPVEDKKFNNDLALQQLDQIPTP